MQVVSVTYRELLSGAGYNHRAIEATASVDANETPEQALEGLRRWVRERHSDYAGHDARVTGLLEQETVVARRVAALTNKVQRLERELAQTSWWSVRVKAWRRRWRQWRTARDYVPF